MKCIPLDSQTQARTGFTHKFVITAADVAALGASASAALQLLPENIGSGSETNPVGTAVVTAGMRLVTAFDFSDAAINSLLVEAGDGGDPNRFLDQTETAVDGTEITYGISLVATMPYVYLAADTIDLTFTAAGGASPLLSECTSGEVEIYLGIVAMADLAII